MWASAKNATGAGQNHIVVITQRRRLLVLAKIAIMQVLVAPWTRRNAMSDLPRNAKFVVDWTRPESRCLEE